MESTASDPGPPKVDEEQARRLKRIAVKDCNMKHAGQGPCVLAALSTMYSNFKIYLEPTKALDSSLKRHTALIKRIRQSLTIENRDQIVKDIETLSLEKYVDELAGAVLEGMGRCKTEKDVWSAVEVCPAVYATTDR